MCVHTCTRVCVHVCICVGLCIHTIHGFCNDHDDDDLHYRGEEGGVQSKKELIMTARLIAKESEAVTAMARKVAAVCTDKRMKNVSSSNNIVYIVIA